MHSYRDPHRLLFGLLGSDHNSSELKRYWNSLFLEEGIDAFFDHYPANEESLPERLSEMFHFDRRGYIVGKSLQKAIIPLLDLLDSSVQGEGSASVIVNNEGVLTGYFLSDQGAIRAVWLPSSRSSDVNRS